MPKLIIMTGVSGQGKSTLANEIADDFNFCEVLSTDNYWIRADGDYDFNSRLLEQAHNWTFNQFKEMVEDIDNPESNIFEYLEAVVLDNTNLRFSEFERYPRLAFEHGWIVEIVEPETDWKDDVDALFKASTHKVPLQTIQRQFARKEPVEVLREKLEKLRFEVIHNGVA